MTTPQREWTWVGTEHVEAIHRLARWSQPATSITAVLVLVACFASLADSGLGESSSLVNTFAFMTVVCLIFAAVTARALPQVAAASSLDTRRSRRFAGFSILLCATSWLFGVVLVGATSLARGTSPIPLVAGIVGSILLSVVATRTVQLASPRPAQRARR